MHWTSNDWEPVDFEVWRAAVERPPKGVPLAPLSTRGLEGIEIAPLYTQRDALQAIPASDGPGFGSRARGFRALGGHHRPRRFAVYDDMPPAAVRAALARELGAGLDAPLLELGGAVAVCDLESALVDIDVGATPIFVGAGHDFPGAAAALFAMWRRRCVPPERSEGAILADPLGALAASGRSAAHIEDELDDLAELTAFALDGYPNVSTTLVSTVAYSEAGAHAVQEIATAAATGIAYLTAFEKAGLDVAKASGKMVFGVAVGTDQFLEIAKLRALRIVWNRILAACSVPEDARVMTVHAHTARRAMAANDPWMNRLRATIGCFAAIVGGADWVSAAAFDAGVDGSDEARRLARNTLLVLQEESHVDLVIDPAGGSYYVESLTRALAEKAWAQMQAIQRRGGMLAMQGALG